MRDLETITEELLDKHHIKYINEFQCIDINGDKQVQLFLKKDAINLMERNLVRTRLFFDEGKSLIGFYSLFNDTIKMNRKKRQEISIHLPEKVKEILAIRLHFLGVDSKHRDKGYGKYMMASVLTNCVQVAKISGCPLIIIESTDGAKGFYTKFDFKFIRPKGNYKLMAMNTKKLLNLV